jgi:hypothetical protein
MVLHSFAEYLAPCPGAPAQPVRGAPASPRETVLRADRVTISDLDLGRGSSRRSFIERLTRIVVLGERPGAGLEGLAQPRPAAPVVRSPRCGETRGVSLWINPEAPNAHQPLRVIAASARFLDPVELVLVDPAGRELRPEVHRLGGPPFGFWASVPSPAPGRWTARLGDGSRVEACRRIRVWDAPPRPRQRDEGPVWEPRRAWREETELLYALFVEQLFDYPDGDDRTWTGLQALLDNPDQNLLFAHFGRSEESELKLRPDCADLAYYLRAYFAWKLALPFGLRRCDRGGANRPPTCGELETNLRPREQGDDVKEFVSFINRDVRSGVHSGNGRTRPKDDNTDFYPVPLRREALRPGTVFADPYGHVLIVAKWVPQGAARPGILIGADAQPDGTVGRRRFWRGTFLFPPDTREVGAGFKAFRPLRYLRKEGTLESVENAKLRGARDHVAWSDEQNRGTTDEFYDRVEALINPRPLDPAVRLRDLCDALAESARRRVTSVDNGERFVAGHREPMAMPSGHAIFETKGPWEDYATPSRDMRLLIAIDTVLGFPAEVRRRPQHFGLTPEQAATTALALEGQLGDELRRRTLTYARSDGSSVTLTLADLTARRVALEIAYNPNDCVELRWGAAAGSAEAATCRRRAPEHQRKLMEEYRSWFHNRRRPVR